MTIGIVSYGAYVPRYRIKVEEIARVWGDNADALKSGLMVYEKSVPDIDEDAATIAVEAARYAMARSGVDPERIGAVYTGSESHPYAVKPTSTIVAQAIGATPNMMAYELGADLAIYHRKGQETVSTGRKGTISRNFGSVAGKNCVIVDDVITTGSTSMEVIEQLREMNAKPRVVVVLVDKKGVDTIFNVPIKSLLRVVRLD